MTVRFGSEGPGHVDGDPGRVRWTSRTASRSPSPAPRRTNGSSWTSLLGDANLFPRTEEVELSWRILDPIEGALGRARASPRYASGALGPPRRTRCSHETDGAGAGHEDRPHRHHGKQDQQGARARAPRHRARRRRAWC
ncbi:hypothetical protein [Streptomyces sp. KL116D]|uniref:hypothetical protein n=1 Tax=Streptomyces sp. KL116D TaxID=3045152 RepID=UPI003558B4AD